MLENMIIHSRSYSCAVRTLLESLSEADQVILRDNLANENIAHYALAQALKSVGIVIADSTVTRHRQGRCSCSRI